MKTNASERSAHVRVWAGGETEQHLPPERRQLRQHQLGACLHLLLIPSLSDTLPTAPRPPPPSSNPPASAHSGFSRHFRSLRPGPHEPQPPPPGRAKVFSRSAKLRPQKGSPTKAPPSPPPLLGALRAQVRCLRQICGTGR
ncbi:hypothetical protein AAHC03_0363 [Spirometra sp. Aus1]